MKAIRSRAVESAIVGIHTLLLLGAVITVLSVGKDICVPIALAALLSFLLAPLVTRLERWIGRITAVVLLLLAVSGCTGILGYIVAHQIIDLSEKLPDYQDNIQAKLRYFQFAKDGQFSRFSRTLEELRKELPGAAGSGADASSDAKKSTKPMQVQVVETKSVLAGNAQIVVGPIIRTFALTGLVLLLSLFMLLRREDLRGRLIRLMGQSHISLTTHALAEARSRVWKFLIMQLIVNATYGIPVAVGLYFIGVPNALLWGALAIVLRFIPYVGPWVAAAIPIALSLAVTDSWTMPLMTIGLFVVLELISNNIMEPWLYGASTGVTSLALILAAVFWTWLWGPIGLVLATPLTVCLVVMGRHVPKLEFLSILLSDEEPLKPYQECYHRLLRADLTEGTALVVAYLKQKHNSFTSLYDDVLIPVLGAAEIDFSKDDLDSEERAGVQQGVRDILDDLTDRPLEIQKVVTEQDAFATVEKVPFPKPCRVLCIPVRATRDELAAAMLAHALTQQGFTAETLSTKATTAELVELAEQRTPDAICISVVSPSSAVHARNLCVKLHARLPKVKVVVCLWGSKEIADGAAPSLGTPDTAEVVTSISEAVIHLGKFAAESTQVESRVMSAAGAK